MAEAGALAPYNHGIYTSIEIRKIGIPGGLPMAQPQSQRPPFRADHVGSLLRPKALREAFRRHAGGELSQSAFEDIQDQAIRDAVRLQEEVGLEVVTDGEFRRS